MLNTQRTDISTITNKGSLLDWPLLGRILLDGADLVVTIRWPIRTTDIYTIREQRHKAKGFKHLSNMTLTTRGPFTRESNQFLHTSVSYWFLNILDLLLLFLELSFVTSFWQSFLYRGEFVVASCQPVVGYIFLVLAFIFYFIIIDVPPLFPYCYPNPIICYSLPIICYPESPRWTRFFGESASHRHRPIYRLGYPEASF